MYTGGSLVHLFSRQTTRGPTRALLHGVARDAAQAMRDSAVAHTPRRTGRTAAGWRIVGERELPDGSIESGIVNRAPLAHILEYGTDPHEIKPRHAEALDIPGAGEPRASAEHPGTEGHHMTAKAAAEVEALLPGIGHLHATKWAEAIEANAAKHPGIEKS